MKKSLFFSVQSSALIVLSSLTRALLNELFEYPASADLLTAPPPPVILAAVLLIAVFTNKERA